VLHCQLDFILQTASRLFKLPKIKKFTGCSMPKIHYLAAQTFASKEKTTNFQASLHGLKHGELWKSHKI
jgi:hypothetical protein